MKFWITNGDLEHEHWFLWTEVDSELESIAANRSIDRVCKDLGRFRQVNRLSAGCSPFDCSNHFDCPGVFGWEMWALHRNNPQGEQVLTALLPDIQSLAQDMLQRMS